MAIAALATRLSLMHIGVLPEKRGRTHDDAFEALAPVMRALVLLQLKQRQFDEMDAASAAMREYVHGRSAVAIAAEIAAMLPVSFASLAHQRMLTAPHLNALAVLLFSVLPGEYRRRGVRLDVPALAANAIHDVFRLWLYAAGGGGASPDPLYAQTIAAAVASDPAALLGADAAARLQALTESAAQKRALQEQASARLNAQLADFVRENAPLQRQLTEQEARIVPAVTDANTAAEVLLRMDDLATKQQALVAKHRALAGPLREEIAFAERAAAAAASEARDFRAQTAVPLSLGAGAEPWRASLHEHTAFVRNTINGAVLLLAPTLVPRTAQSGGGLPRPQALEQYLGTLHHGAQMLQLAARLDFLSGATGRKEGAAVLVVDVYFDDDGRALSTYNPDAPGQRPRSSSMYCVRAFNTLFGPLREHLEPGSESAVLYACLEEVVERSADEYRDEVRGFADIEAKGRDVLVHVLENYALLNAARRYADFTGTRMRARYESSITGLDSFGADVQSGAYNAFGKAMARALRALLLYAWSGDRITAALFDVCAARFRGDEEARAKRAAPAPEPGPSAQAPPSPPPAAAVPTLELPAVTLDQARAALGSGVHADLLDAISVVMEGDYDIEAQRAYAKLWASKYGVQVLRLLHTYLVRFVRAEEAEAGVQALDDDDPYVVFRDVVGALAFDKQEAELQRALLQEDSPL